MVSSLLLQLRLKHNAGLTFGLLINAGMFRSYFCVETGRAPGRDIAIRTCKGGSNSLTHSFRLRLASPIRMRPFDQTEFNLAQTVWIAWSSRPRYLSARPAVTALAINSSCWSTKTKLRRLLSI